MAKIPLYLEVEWSYKPTETDRIGCDGIYIKRASIKWWYWPIMLVKLLIKSTGRQ